jgi:PilZ domain-containing protein
MNDEKRKNERVSTNLSARCHGAAGACEGRVEDLSLSGCFINTKGNVDPGEVVSLLIQLPSGGWLPLRGKVVFFQQLTGFSVSFLRVEEKDREALEQLVAAQTKV